MKKLINLIFCITTFIFYSFLNISSIVAQNGRVERITVNGPSLASNILGDDTTRFVSVYLPEVYDQNITERFAVIYMLHGFTYTDESFMNTIKSACDFYFSQENVQPMIIVIPNAYNTYRGSWYTNSIVTGNWEDFITQDLVDYIDSHYRSIPISSKRGIAGHSMGGYGAFKLAMKHPELFSSIYALSCAFVIFEEVILGPLYNYLVQAINAPQFNGLPWQSQAVIAAGAAFTPNYFAQPFFCDFPVDSNGDLIDTTWTKWLEHDLYTQMASYRTNLMQLNIKFDCGNSDFNLAEPTLNFHHALDSNNIPHTYDTYIGNHTNKIAERVRDHLLPFFSGLLTDYVKSDSLLYNSKFCLIQNYPNPFNPTTTIKYSIPKQSIVSLKLYDVLGREITTLFQEERKIGTYKLEFDGSNLTSGIYLYQLKAGDFIQTKKMVLLR
jgi:S-formylglutathione hydrolase